MNARDRAKALIEESRNMRELVQHFSRVVGHRFGYPREMHVLKGAPQRASEAERDLEQALRNEERECSEFFPYRDYRQTAIRLHHDEGRLEIDSDARVVPPEEDPRDPDTGAWVAAWVWVPHEQVR